MAEKSSFYLIIDLEATCWERHDPQRRENEIIEIGLVILSSLKEELWSGGWFVRPKSNQILSDFCTSLTSIKQANIDSAPFLPSAMSMMETQVLTVTGKTLRHSFFVSWGNFDRVLFEKECARHSIDYPFGEHINLKQVFLKAYNLKIAGLPTVLNLLNLPLLGTHHRGIDDAINISRIFQKMDSPISSAEEIK